MKNEEKMENDKEGFKISCSFTRRLSSSFFLLFLDFFTLVAVIISD